MMNAEELGEFKITDQTTVAEMVERLGRVCNRSKRIMQVVGTERLPTEWDRLHKELDSLLDHIKCRVDLENISGIIEDLETI